MIFIPTTPNPESATLNPSKTQKDRDKKEHQKQTYPQSNKTSNKKYKMGLKGQPQTGFPICL
jgi:hypothetical protein